MHLGQNVRYVKPKIEFKKKRFTRNFTVEIYMRMKLTTIYEMIKIRMQNRRQGSRIEAV